MEETSTTIAEQFKKLPRNLQEAILSPSLKKRLGIVAEKHNLNLVQEAALETEAVLVMLGLESALDFPENLERALAIPQEELADLMHDVESAVFSPIRELLVYFLESESEAEDPYAELPAPLLDTKRDESPHLRPPQEKTRPNDFDPYREPIE